MAANRGPRIQELLRIFGVIASNLSDASEAGRDYVYSIADALKSALAVFYFQHPSLLNFQQEMKRKWKLCNLETLFGATKVPCTEQIKNIVDNINPDELEAMFDQVIDHARNSGIIDGYRILDHGVLIPLDGVWYFSSEKIHCDHCLRKVKNSKGGKVG